MSLRERFGRAGRAFVSKAATTSSAFASLLFGKLGSHSHRIPDSMAGYAKAFAQNEWVSAGIDYRATNIGSIPFKLMRPEGGTMVEVPAHPILDMINNTTEVAEMTASRTYQIEQDTSVYGPSFLFIETLNQPQPMELIRIPPQRVQVIRSKEPGILIARYKVTLQDGSQSTVEPRDMIYFAPRPDPENPTASISLIRSIRSVVEQAQGADQYNAGWFFNSGRPDVVITTPDTLKAPQRAEIVDEWNEEHNGPGATGGITVLSNGAKAELLTTSPKEADFNKSQATFMLRILGKIRVNPVLLGHQAANRATMEAAKLSFWDELAIPQAEYYARVYTMQLLPRFKDTKGWVVKPVFDNVTALIDREFVRIDSAVKSTGGVAIKTPNEARKLFGDGPEPGGDVLYASATLIPITTRTPRIGDGEDAG